MGDRSTVLAAVLAFTFFVFITTKGELLDYLGTVGLGPKANAWKGNVNAGLPSKGSGGSGGGGNPLSDLMNMFSGGGSGGGSGPDISQFAQYAADFAAFAG